MALIFLMVVATASCQSRELQTINIPASGFVESAGLRIFFQRFDQGPSLVLVHGWGADSKINWIDSGWIVALQEYRTLIAIDVRGHGKSDKPHSLEPYSYAAMSQDVLAVLDAHNINKSDLMGYSLGAFMGAYLLGHHPERFTSMILGGIGDETALSAAQGDVIGAALRAPRMITRTWIALIALQMRCQTAITFACRALTTCRQYLMRRSKVWSWHF